MLLLIIYLFLACLLTLLLKNPPALQQILVLFPGWEDPLEEGQATHSRINTLASLVAQLGKNPPAIRDTWVRSLGWEFPLEKEMATHFSFLAWRIPMDSRAGGPQSMGSKRVGHD